MAAVSTTRVRRLTVVRQVMLRTDTARERRRWLEALWMVNSALVSGPSRLPFLSFWLVFP
jgi:hypothetical protein